MRHKQRPVKSSRHKSVTFIIDSPQTSFIDNNIHNQSNSYQLQQQFQTQQDEQYDQYHDYQQTIDNDSHQDHHSHNHNHRRNNNYNQSYDNKHQSSASDVQSPFMRKQFEHNVRHMSDIMRLAFLENNDISPETWGDVDFNSLSTASILQRNIQHQLQQQRREQLQLKQQQQHHHHQQQQQRQQNQQQQQQSRHWQPQKSQQHQRQQQQQQQQHYLDQQQFHLDDDYQTFSDVDIFATALPTTSTSGGRQNRNIASTPRATSSNINENNLRKTARAREASGGSRLSGAHEDLSSQSSQEDISMYNQGDGFLCDEPGCGKSFSSLRKLRHHKVVHSDDFPFVCEFQGCGKKFKRKFGIDLHSTTHFDLDPDMYKKTSNNSSLPFFGRRMQYSMCKPCGQKFKTVHEYQYHMLKHGKEPFKCPVKGCGQTFSIWKSFQKHRASHYFNYYCQMDSRCNHHTSNLQLLKLHIYCCHFRRHLPENATLSSRDRVHEEDSKEVGMDVVENDDGEANLEVDGDDAQLQVDDDEANLQVDDDLNDHYQQPQQQHHQVNHHRYKHEVSYDASSAFENESMMESSGTTEPEPPVTPRRDSRLRKNPPRSSTFSHQDYTSMTALPTTSTSGGRQNRNIASTPRATSSNINENNLRKTARAREASGGSRLSGAHEDLSSQSIQEDNMSMQNQGDGFLCDEPGCGKSFPSLRKLRHHKVVHSDEFPFVCQFQGCGKRFKRKFGIDLHSTTHFDLDPDMYNKTSNNSSLPFFGRRMQYSMCKPCGQKFKTVHEYQYHMLKHGKEPFKCPVKGCGQTFSIWKSFQKHRASHYFNYYCRMDPGCEHHTSNLQLLKLHIYCCHFRRILPENATLSSRDRVQDEEDSKEVRIDVVDNDDGEAQLQVDDDLDDLDQQQQEQPYQHQVKQEAPIDTSSNLEDSSMMNDSATTEPEPPVTPRRDSRLRKNPPRSSTFGHQDYASVNNGKNTIRQTPSTPTSASKRTRSSVIVTAGGGSTGGRAAATGGTGAGSQSSPDKKPKLPLKILPKRSAQRLPMSLLAADDASTEDDDEDDSHSHHQAHSSDEDGSLGPSRDGDGSRHEDPTGRSRFRCHLCDFKFNVRFQLTKHLSTHLELTPDMYSATADTKVIQISERRRREFFCDKCGLKFEQMPDLDVHMRKHGQRPYVCNFCPQPSTFRLAKQYLSHLYEHRFNYKCIMDPKCEFTINRKDALKLHIFRMHLNQKLPSYIENFATMFNENEF